MATLMLSETFKAPNKEAQFTKEMLCLSAVRPHG